MRELRDTRARMVRKFGPTVFKRSLLRLGSLLLDEFFAHSGRTFHINQQKCSSSAQEQEKPQTTRSTSERNCTATDRPYNHTLAELRSALQASRNNV
jgi:hypothetical protein